MRKKTYIFILACVYEEEHVPKNHNSLALCSSTRRENDVLRKFERFSKFSQSVSLVVVLKEEKKRRRGSIPQNGYQAQRRGILKMEIKTVTREC